MDKMLQVASPYVYTSLGGFPPHKLTKKESFQEKYLLFGNLFVNVKSKLLRPNDIELRKY